MLVKHVHHEVWSMVIKDGDSHIYLLFDGLSMFITYIYPLKLLPIVVNNLLLYSAISLHPVRTCHPCIPTSPMVASMDATTSHQSWQNEALENAQPLALGWLHQAGISNQQGPSPAWLIDPNIFQRCTRNGAAEAHVEGKQRQSPLVMTAYFTCTDGRVHWSLLRESPVEAMVMNQGLTIINVYQWSIE